MEGELLGVWLGGLADGATVVLVLAGAFFFLAGTVGLLRFPDVYCRLHALTKADTLGLGLIVLGLTFQVGTWPTRILLLVIWFLALVAAATVCHLLADASLRSGVEPLSGAPKRGEDKHEVSS
jgi:multicomponent Na+:H+ antiporter subunit G